VLLSFLSGDSLFIIFLAAGAVAPVDSLLCTTSLHPEYLCPISHTRAKHSKTTIPDRPQYIQPRHAAFVGVGTKSKNFASISSYLKYTFSWQGSFILPFSCVFIYLMTLDFDRKLLILLSMANSLECQCKLLV